MNHAKDDIPDNLVPLPLPGDKMSSGTRHEFGGGSGGGGMLDKLEKRVDAIEKDISQMKIDLTKLTTRSEEFATKSGLAELNSRAENFATKAAMAELVARSGEFATKGDLHREISSQTKWIAATIIGVAALCMTAAKFLF
ncbi:TPA: hypothetical protein ACXIGW_000110 [Serratia marcescens]